MLDHLIHRWLHIPYALHVRHDRRPKKSKRVTVLFIHGLGTNGAFWDHIISKLPADTRVLSIDLLGFGDSKAPSWTVYDAKTQARSVMSTILKLRITTPFIIVGHSLGALVAIEIAKRYPLLVNSLILCSPPVYSDGKSALFRFPRNEILLRRLYRASYNHPDRFLKIAALAFKYKLMRGALTINDGNIDSYMEALNSMIINQTSLKDAKQLKVPTLIIGGRHDPVIIPKNYRMLAKANPNISVKTIKTGHDIVGVYRSTIVEAINDRLNNLKKNDIKRIG
jgi:pimeloyl-ACP methyl ester carboxylesterase